MGIRVVVCYTGGVGLQAIRLLAQNPRMEIVGVLVHHEDKQGRDAGELAGIAPLGVSATRDVDALVNLRADCALWHSLTWEPEIIGRFLAAGTNVYSSVGGWFLPGEKEYEQLEAAAQRGGATFVAGGNIPGLISDVLPLFVSGYTGAVRRIRAFQSDYVPHYPSALQLELGLGFGVPPNPDPTVLSAVDEQWLWGIRQSVRLVGEGLGVPVTDVAITKKEYGLSPQDMVLDPSGLRIAAGTPAGVRWTFTGFSGDEPFFEIVNEQTARLDLGEGWRTSADEPNWRVEIDGRPSISCVVDLRHEAGGIDPVAALNAARAVNFIPVAVAGPPGCRSVLDLPAPRTTGFRLGAKV
jgi:4-hydroxy-tetrahydrodipicolinate reductase